MIDYLLLDLDNTLYPRSRGLGVAPGSTLFVDDVVEYLLPFQEMGGMVVHLAGETPETGGTAGSAGMRTIVTLRELVPIIEQGRSSA